VNPLADFVSLGLRNHLRLFPISGAALRPRSVDSGFSDQVQWI
jgi:hypothetical protein